MGTSEDNKQLRGIGKALWFIAGAAIALAVTSIVIEILIVVHLVT